MYIVMYFIVLGGLPLVPGYTWSHTLNKRYFNSLWYNSVLYTYIIIIAWGLHKCYYSNYGVIIQIISLKAGSQYDAKVRVPLHRAHIWARRNATKCKGRLGSYPCVPLRCILASGHEKSRICEYFCITQAQCNTMHVPLRHIVNRP